MTDRLIADLIQIRREAMDEGRAKDALMISALLRKLGITLTERKCGTVWRRA
jgi:hypothetical protein